MAETQRTRAALLALYADNVTGQISPEDLRDGFVTIMEEEFANPGDFWKQPAPGLLTTDRSIKGWIDYSQIMLSACSFGDPLVLTESNTWRPADLADSGLNPALGLAGDSYAAADSQAQILREGLLYLSALSARFSGFIGRPIYLQSTGGLSVTIGTSVAIIGIVEPDGIASIVSSKLRFRPDWGVTGA